jgi:60 kDa SS-A/Ro ribonucleoprotein
MKKGTIDAMAYTPLVKNEAGGLGYPRETKAALCALALTGTTNDAYYTPGTDTTKKLVEYAGEKDYEFVGKLAAYARQVGWMKDMPAVLVAWLYQLSGTDPAALDTLRKVFPKVIDNIKMLSVLTQLVMSGCFGKRTWFSSGLQRLVNNWLDQQTPEQLFWASVGYTPGLADVLRLCHPKGVTPQHVALYQYLRGKPYTAADLPEVVTQWEALRTGESEVVPAVPFQMLTNVTLNAGQWEQIMRNSSWQQLRMNLNNFARHGAFTRPEALKAAVARLQDPAEVRRAKVFPHQLFMAYLNAAAEVPPVLRDALQAATEVALENIALPQELSVAVVVDVSASMRSPLTGANGSATTKVRVVDVAALVASAILRRCPNTKVVPVDTEVRPHRLSRFDSVLSNAKLLADYGGGGTHLSKAFEALARSNERFDLIVVLSDNESWRDYEGTSWGLPARGFSPTQGQYAVLKQRNPGGKLVCVDLQPYATAQVSPKDKSVMFIRGWNDQCWPVVNSFLEGEASGEATVRAVEAVQL